MKINTQEQIDTLFNNFSDFLKEKNKRYGDSVINPVKIFSKVEPTNKACIRLDEKLQRIINSDELRKNDVSDTFGYLALLMIDKGWLTFEEMLD
jgi:chromatin remodeling complex protein RSC6